LCSWLFGRFSHKPGGTSPSVTRISAKYALERHLGGGGMAEVFLARSNGAEGFTRRVALKRMLPRLSEDAEFARLFVSEAQLTSRLQHPNLVSVMDFDRDDHGRLFLVMELVEGVDLDGLLDTGPLSFPLVIYLAIEILSGLRYAHDLPLQAEDGVRGIIHRDISPHNVLLSWEGAVKVSDFGIAKSRAFTHAAATAVVKGKPAYMSPEQANGHPLDGRSDLFAVGVMLWEMLCLRPLFRGATARDTIGQMLFAPISSPSAVRPDVPEDLSHVVLRLLARDRAQRTPNADAAITELVACADHARDGRGILIQTLADRFTGHAAIQAHGAAPSAGGLATVTAPPGVVLDPLAPHVRGGPTCLQCLWIVLTGSAVIGSLAGGGLALYLGKRESAPPVMCTHAPAQPAIPNATSTRLQGPEPPIEASSAKPRPEPETGHAAKHAAPGGRRPPASVPDDDVVGVAAEAVVLPAAVEGDGTEQVDHDTGDDQCLGKPGKRATADREEHHEQHEVVEAEPITELDPAAVLVQERRQRDEGNAQPERAVQRIPLARP
jgi:hypothetical protein